MASTTQASGQVNPAVIGTEHVLATINVPGVFTCWVDLFNMATGDSVTLRAYKMAKPGGTSRIYREVTMTGVQPVAGKMFKSDPISNSLTDADAVKFTLTQGFGAAGRVFDYSVDRAN